MAARDLVGGTEMVWKVGIGRTPSCSMQVGIGPVV